MTFTKATVLFLICSGFLFATDDWQISLARIQRSVLETISRTDNYICAQDLSRFYYSAAKSACRETPEIPSTEPTLKDRLKLDVAVSEGNEIYSWHGEHKFSGATVSEIVQNGPISSGSFTGYLRNIFAERGIVFTYRGQTTKDGLTLDRFDYVVPLASSHYEMQAGKGYVTAPFHGSFTAVSETYQLYSLNVVADNDGIPDKSDICAAQSVLTYQLVKIGTHQSLLPSTFDLTMGTRDGVMTDSKGRFTQCREYTGESTVHFDVDAAGDTAPKIAELQSEPLKSGVILPIALATNIDEESAYAGQEIEAVLTHNVKVTKQISLSRGALLKGTITRFQIFNRPEHSVAMRIEFESITDGDKLYLCSAVHYVEPGSSPAYVNIGRRRIPQPTQGGGTPLDGDLHFENSHVRLDKHFSSVFVTIRQNTTEAP